MRTKKEAEELYLRLQKAYSPHYYPSSEEKASAIFELQHLGNLNEAEMISKIEKLSIIHGDHKTKITTLISNRYWEQKIDFGVKANIFKPEN